MRRRIIAWAALLVLAVVIWLLSTAVTAAMFLAGQLLLNWPWGSQRTRRRVHFWSTWAAIGIVCWLLWHDMGHPVLACGLFLLYALLSLPRRGRARYVDFGRFTVGAWPVTPTAPLLIFGIGWSRHGDGPRAKKAGLEIILGRVVVGAFSLVPRAEWPAYKRSQAAFAAQQKEARP